MKHMGNAYFACSLEKVANMQLRKSKYAVAEVQICSCGSPSFTFQKSFLPVAGFVIADIKRYGCVPVQLSSEFVEGNVDTRINAAFVYVSSVRFSEYAEPTKPLADNMRMKLCRYRVGNRRNKTVC
jgi:hypothetical protein